MSTDDVANKKLGYCKNTNYLWMWFQYFLIIFHEIIWTRLIVRIDINLLLFISSNLVSSSLLWQRKFPHHGADIEFLSSNMKIIHQPEIDSVVGFLSFYPFAERKMNLLFFCMWFRFVHLLLTCFSLNFQLFEFDSHVKSSVFTSLPCKLVMLDWATSRSAKKVEMFSFWSPDTNWLWLDVYRGTYICLEHFNLPLVWLSHELNTERDQHLCFK